MMGCVSKRLGCMAEASMRDGWGKLHWRRRQKQDGGLVWVQCMHAQALIFVLEWRDERCGMISIGRKH